MSELMTGPCIVCGGKNYPLSCGGPSICPACDCGISPEVKKLTEENYQLRARVERLESILRQYEAAVELNEHIHTSWSVYYETKEALAETEEDR